MLFSAFTKKGRRQKTADRFVGRFLFCQLGNGFEMRCACTLYHFIQRTFTSGYKCAFLYCSLDGIVFVVNHSGAYAVSHDEYTVAFADQVDDTLQHADMSFYAANQNCLFALCLHPSCKFFTAQC